MTTRFLKSWVYTPTSHHVFGGIFHDINHPAIGPPISSATTAGPELVAGPLSQAPGPATALWLRGRPGMSGDVWTWENSSIWGKFIAAIWGHSLYMLIPFPNIFFGYIYIYIPFPNMFFGDSLYQIDYHLEINLQETMDFPTKYGAVLYIFP